MSDLVKEAAPSLSPTTDSSNQAINKRKLLALSSRGTASGGFDGGQASLVVDAFAEVFASMAIASPPPIENVESVPVGTQASDDAIGSSNQSDESGQDDSQSSLTDENGTQSQDLVVNEFAVQAEVAKGVEVVTAKEIDPQLSKESEASELAVIKAKAENESTEASQLAVAATVATSASEVELGNQPARLTSEGDESGEAKPNVSPVNADTSKTTNQPIDNRQTPQPATAEAGDLQSNEQADGRPNGNGGEQPESGDRRRYTKDEGSANERPITAGAEKSAATTKAISANQQSESVINQASGVAALPNGDRPAAPPVTAAANAAVAAVAAASSASAVAGSASGSAPKRATGTAGIAGNSATADASRMVTGSDPGGRPEWAPQSKPSSKSDASTNQAETLNRIKLVQRVSRAFQHLGPDGGVVRLRLAPVELGTVRVEMQIQQKKVNARVVAETDAASNALREHLPELRARLEAHGMQIESLEVETQSSDSDSSALGQRSQKDSSDQRQANSERQSRLDRSEPNNQSRVVAAPVSRQPVSLASAGGVDIRF